jgi:hypothetical protein
VGPRGPCVWDAEDDALYAGSIACCPGVSQPVQEAFRRGFRGTSPRSKLAYLLPSVLVGLLMEAAAHLLGDHFLYLRRGAFSDLPSIAFLGFGLVCSITSSLVVSFLLFRIGYAPIRVSGAAW